MRPLVTLIALCIGCLTTANAQTFTQRLQQTKAGEGRVTVTHSQSVDNLVNGITVQKDSSKVAVTPEEAKALLRQLGSRDTTTKYNTTYRQDTINTIDSTIDTNKKVMRGGHKVWGYRVQIFAGGNQRRDRQQAERIGNEIKALFPTQPVYVHFYSPRWICRMGNYRTYEDALQMLSNVKKVGYNSATVIKEKITVLH